MNASVFGRFAAACGVLAGLAAIGGGLYARSVQPEFGTPGLFGLDWGVLLAGDAVLVGAGVLMVIGGVAALRWCSVGAVVVCLAAMAGLVFTYDRGDGAWLPLLYYWAAPWLLAWISGVFAGYALHARVEPYGNGVKAVETA